ncbi:hypothetical protein U1Q18_011751 [Sarracenia purpurea var. burkii]
MRTETLLREPRVLSAFTRGPKPAARRSYSRISTPAQRQLLGDFNPCSAAAAARGFQPLLGKASRGSQPLFRDTGSGISAPARQQLLE